MVRSSFSILFYVRESKVRKNGTVSIEVAITVNGKRCYFSTGKLVALNNWDKEKQQAKGKNAESKAINVFLQALRSTLYNKEAELLDAGFVISAELLRDAYFDKVESLKEHTLFEVFEEHNVEQEKQVGISLSKDTYWISVYTLRLTKEYVEQKYQRKDLYLRELNLTFIEDFHTFLRTDKGMAQNSSIKHVKLLKKVMNRCIANGYISANPFLAFKIVKEPVEIDFLDYDELNKVINFDSPLPRLEKARDMFLFGCFTGLSYIDIKTLAPEHFEKDANGRIWIKKKRVKTKILSRIPLLPMAKLILDKYKGNTKLLPIQDPADINKYLKDIAILCGIKKHVTFHTSRHTFATTVTLSNNISLEVIAKMMGHTNTRMTSHYAKVLDQYIMDEMEKLEGKF